MTTTAAQKGATFHVEASKIIDAPPSKLYALLADYRVGHPSILPKPYFTGLTVEQGGVGAGTIVNTQMKVMGQTIQIRQLVSEPEPGRVLAETDMKTGQYTEFVFEPVDGGQKTNLRIVSEFPVQSGIMGWLTKLTQPGIVRKIYRQELDIIADRIRGG